MRSIRWIAVAAICVCASAVVHASQTVSYSYDALGRLTATQIEGGPGSGITQTFEYDPAGNRTQYQVTTQPALSMSSSVVNLTQAGATLTVNLSDPAATGTVTFTENGTTLGTASVVNGQATVVLQGYPQGTHTLTASYSGDGTGDAPQTTTFTIKVQSLNWLPAVLQLLLQ